MKRATRVATYRSRATAGLPGGQPGAYKTPKPWAGKSGQSPILCSRARRQCAYARLLQRRNRLLAHCINMQGGPLRGLCSCSIRNLGRRFDRLAQYVCFTENGRSFVVSAPTSARISDCIRPGLLTCVFTHSVFLRKMAFSHAASSWKAAASSGWAWLDSCPIRHPPVRAPINMTDQNRASASSVPYRLVDPVR